MTFNTEVIGCWWQDETGKWKVKLRQTRRDGETREFDETCDLLLHATGILNNFKWPDVEGIEKIKRRMIHTARWPKDYQQEQWKNDRVAVIGSGASSIQTVPSMQPYTKHLDVFVRTVSSSHIGGIAFRLSCHNNNRASGSWKLSATVAETKSTPKKSATDPGTTRKPSSPTPKSSKTKSTVPGT